LRCIQFLSFFLLAIIILELSNALASPLDSHSSWDINDTSSKIIQMISNDSEHIGNTTNVSSSSGSQQNENDTAPAILPVRSDGIMTNSSLPLSAVSNNNTCVTYDSINRTVNICGGSADLRTIDQVINNSDILNNTSHKNWILNANVSVGYPLIEIV
jgi:hypothetical protein